VKSHEYHDDAKDNSRPKDFFITLALSYVSRHKRAMAAAENKTAKNEIHASRALTKRRPDSK
jgi:hypothetical protein